MSVLIQTLVSLSAAPALLTTKELPVTNALFLTTPKGRMGLRSLSATLLLHGFVIAVLAQWPHATESIGFARAEHHRYSVRFIQLQARPELHETVATTSAVQTLAQFRDFRNANSTEASGSSVRPHIRLKLDSRLPVQQVPQTLVQMDLPPIELHKEVALPNLLLWREQSPSMPDLASREMSPAELNRVESGQSNAPTLVSLLDNPVRSSTLLVLPPVNQVASADAAGAGSVNDARGSGNQGAAGSGDTAAVHNSEPSLGHSLTSAGGSMSGTDLKGVTRIDLPRDGKFGFVVLGSGSSAPYPDTAGALSGKVVYTVYIKVGLRKSWILQYCLPNSASGGTAGNRSAPVQAPWPYLIMRRDQLNTTSADYILVHGVVSETGNFDQLAMVFPENLESKDLLLNSLKLWAFRPASRDGVPVAVEVLLIIPPPAE